MTTYTLPAEPDGPVWLTDHPEHGGPLRFDRTGSTGVQHWENTAHGIALDWPELLALGVVDDEYLGEFNLHGTATPWHINPTAPREILGADGAEILYVSGEDTVPSADEKLAELIVELVNAHAAGDGPDQSPEAAAAEQAEQAHRDALALAVNELVLHWARATELARGGMASQWPVLAERLDAVLDAHAALNR